MNLQIEKQDPASKIKSKLNGLGITGIHVGEAIIGPVVSGYPISLPNHVPVSKLINKSEDLALALNVASVDIRRIDNKIIIFVPNEERTIVDFKDALFWYLKDETVKEMSLPILLGTNFRGEKSALDLASQPHILMAGSTGAGKSTYESAIIAGLVTLKSPEELEIYLVDTKLVDLTLFANLPHVKQTIKDGDEWALLIDTLYFTIQERMNLFVSKSVRNIKEYNNLNLNKLPYVVVVIDEYADLKEHRKSANDDIQRIAQIARAAGVHLILCTQRTTVDVVGGTIKANFPTRIALRLPQANDSRAIISESGAENLLGNGDMLVKSSTSNTIERYHGPFVRLEDIESIINQREMLRQAVGLS